MLIAINKAQVTVYNTLKYSLSWKLSAREENSPQIISQAGLKRNKAFVSGGADLSSSPEATDSREKMYIQEQRRSNNMEQRPAEIK